MLRILFSIILTVLAVQSGASAAWIHTYHAGRDEKAKAVKEAYAEVDVLNVLRMDETNLMAMAELELSLLENQAILRRDTELFRITRGTGEVDHVIFTNTTRKYWNSLRGTNDLDVTPFAKLTGNALATGMSDLKDKALRVKLTYGVDPPPFDYSVTNLPSATEWFAQHSIPAAKSPLHYENYRRAHAKLVAMVQPVFALKRGRLFEALDRVTKERQRLNALRQQAKAAAAVLQAEVARSKATAAGGFDKKRHQFEQQLTNIHNALGELAKAGEAFGKFAAVTNQLAALDQIIGAAVSTNGGAAAAKVTDPNMRRAMVMASHLHGVLESTGGLTKAVRRPLLMDSLIKREILLIEKEALQRAMARQELRIKLVEDIWLARLSAFDLMRENLRLERNVPAGDKSKTTGWALSDDNNGAWRKDVSEMILNYSHVVRVTEFQERVAEFGLTHLIYQEANDASHSAARMWNSLIANPINQLAAYHSSGIKSEQVADLVVKALGAGAIAWRLK